MSASSGNPEFPTATGGKIGGLFDLGHGWDLHLGLQRVHAETERQALVCAAYEPQIGCQSEATRDDMSLGGFRAGVVRSLVEVGPAEVKLGVGFSFNGIGIESTGLDSGHRGDVYPPSGGQVGALGLLALDVTPVPGIGLAITVGLTEHWVNFDACSSNPNRYDPFCSPATFRELDLGVAYALPR